MTLSRKMACFRSGWNLIRYVRIRGTSILGEVRNVEISRATQQLLCSKSDDFLAVFALKPFQNKKGQKNMQFD